MPWYLIAAFVVATLAIGWWTWRCPSIRLTLYSNSRTLFWTRTTEVLGWALILWDIVLPALSAPELQDALPDTWQRWWPLGLVVLGRLFDRLRRKTALSIAQRRAGW
ncbi:MAG: hypothetical protein A49_08180 [Methyloceanibacter sp.]|nr:MAG: hypothetical protein A49_08180 [Methyloceanibacter sp.]